MSELSKHQCIATPKDSPKLRDSEIAQLQPQIPDWVLETNNEILRLENTFSFGNFIEAMAFANKIADIAEANDHHPALLVQYGSVKVSWWSHSIGGLHLNDFVLAAKTDKAYTNK
jgi:4a-hydroxytetrahydrobiopterin dehydratase